MAKKAASPTKKKSRVARTRAGGEWTEAQYWGFIRNALRRASLRYPPIVRLAWEAAKRPSQSDNARLKWEYQCASCGLWYPKKFCQLDHIYPVGSLLSYDDAPGYLARLFCEVEELQVLCFDCHLDKDQIDG